MYTLKNKNERGITLIALIVTIIVLLILAGVSLNLVAGSDGIIAKASKAVDDYKNGALREKAEMALAELKMDYYIDGAKGTFENYINDKITEGGGKIDFSGGDKICERDDEFVYEDEAGNRVTLIPNEDGEFAIGEIIPSDGSDTSAPIITQVLAYIKSITFTATDRVGIVAYAYTTDTNEPTDWTSVSSTKNLEITIDGLASNQSYYIWVKDEAGHKTRSKDPKTTGLLTADMVKINESSEETVADKLDELYARL